MSEPLDLDDMWNRSDRIYELANACKGHSWNDVSEEVHNYLTYINNKETFPGKEMKLLVLECRRLKKLLYNPETANVFADFLADNGHEETADLLRRTFPLNVPSKEPS